MRKKGLPQQFELFYDELLCELAKVSHIKTMSKDYENWIKIENRSIFVSTKKSYPNYKEIPIKFIQITYEELIKNEEVSQSFLSKTLNVKRSAFIIAAFSLLDNYIQYESITNSIRLISD